MSDEELRRWDEWFEIVGLTEAWGHVKDNVPRAGWTNWASMIELERIDAEVEKKTPTGAVPSGVRSA